MRNFDSLFFDRKKSPVPHFLKNGGKTLKANLKIITEHDNKKMENFSPSAAQKRGRGHPFRPALTLRGESWAPGSHA